MATVEFDRERKREQKLKFWHFSETEQQYVVIITSAYFTCTLIVRFCSRLFTNPTVTYLVVFLAIVTKAPHVRGISLKTAPLILSG